MGNTRQNKQRTVTGHPMVRLSVCAGLFALAARVHTNPDIVLMNKETAP